MPSIRNSAPRHSKRSKRDPTPSGLAAPRWPPLASCLAPAVAAAVWARKRYVPASRRSQQVLAELSRELAELKTELEESKKSNPGA